MQGVPCAGSRSFVQSSFVSRISPADPSDDFLSSVITIVELDSERNALADTLTKH